MITLELVQIENSSEIARRDAKFPFCCQPQGGEAQKKNLSGIANSALPIQL